MIRAVLFDLDGTLFDRVSSLDACIRAQHARHERALSAVPIEQYVAELVELDHRGYVPKDRVYSQLAAHYGLSEATARSLFDDFYVHYHHHAVPFPDLLASLVALRNSGLRLGIITNGGETHQNATINALKIREYFDVILVSETEGVRKPDAAIFLRALERLGLEPREAAFVGDHPEADVQGARNAGLIAVWKRDSYWGECDGADAVVQDLFSLLPVLRSLSGAPA